MSETQLRNKNSHANDGERGSESDKDPTGRWTTNQCTVCLKLCSRSTVIPYQQMRETSPSLEKKKKNLWVYFNNWRNALWEKEALQMS
jgi:hypothetical protein